MTCSPKLGYSSKAAAVFSEDLVRVAADFASFKDLSPDDVLEKLGSGLAGESEPLRALGVFLNEAKVKAEAMRLGLVGAHGELDDGAKVAARYSLIIGEMGEAYGDVSRTADSYANTQRRFAASTENLKAELGQGLLPVLTDLVDHRHQRHGVPVCGRGQRRQRRRLEGQRRGLARPPRRLGEDPRRARLACRQQ